MMKYWVSKIPVPFLKLLAVILLAVITLSIYDKTLEAPFIFDDLPNISENPFIRITRLTPESITRIFRNLGDRPLAYLSFALNFYFHRYDVTGYHATNIAIHMITALLVWMVAGKTLRHCRITDPAAPFFAAALWLVNPVHTQSVTYIVQRMNSMATLFYLLSLFCYIQARTLQQAGGRRRTMTLYFLCCGFSALLGLASKEIVATLPIVFLVYEWCFFYRAERTCLRKRLSWPGLVALSIVGLAVLYLGEDPWDKIRLMYDRYEFTIGQRLVTEAGVVVYYVSLIFFPHPDRLNLDYDFPIASLQAHPLVTILPLLAITAVIAFAFYKPRRHRLLTFMVLWFLITLSIESSFIGLDLVFEHRTYLPSVFPIIAITGLVFFYVRFRTLAITALCIAIGTCGVWTFRRNVFWTDEVRLWQDALQKSPGRKRPYSNLGYALLLKGKADQAMAPLSLGLKLDPFFPDILNTIAIAYQLTGDHQNAIKNCRLAIDIDPDYVEARNTLGFILREKGELAQAENCFIRVLKSAPYNFEAIMNMGLIRRQQGDIKSARYWFEKAARINPASGKAFRYLGGCLVMEDRLTEAIAALHDALAVDTEDYLSHCVLAEILLKQGKVEAAIEHYRQALHIAPDCDVAGIHLARILFKNGDPETAMHRLKETISHSSRQASLLWQAVMLSSEAGHPETALKYLEDLAGLNPENPKLLYNQACLYAVMNDKRSALTALRKAVENGYCNWSVLQTDKDLENIRASSYYQELIGKNWKSK